MIYKEDSASTETINKRMTLLIDKGITKFISSKQLVNDSLTIEDEEKGSRYPSDYDFMIINESEKTKKFKFLNRDLYEVSSPKAILSWKIENETKKIGNYVCQKASLFYCGRNWEAWFTKEVPINAGPYIFNGLPGLILSLKDSKDNFEFIFSGIKKAKNNNIYYFSTKPLAISTIQMEKVFKDYYNDPYREMKSGKMLVVYQDEKGNRIKPDFNELTKNEQQRLRKNNNPIELSEAIRY
jgi:GLPGLI family protein